MEENIGKKIKNIKENKEMVEFDKLPEKIKKKILKQIKDKKNTHPVVPSKIEEGTLMLLDIIKKNPGITKKNLCLKTGYKKKKVKRILNKNKCLIKKKYFERLLKYYYDDSKIIK